MAESQEPEPYRLIDVEPVKTEGVPRYIHQALPAEERTGHIVDYGPVSERPQHLCPNCDYILTGLTSRRCPECGEEFTILEARMRGIELSDGVRRLVRSETIARIKMYAGLVLIVLSVWFQNVGPGTATSVLGLAFTYRGWVMMIFMGPLWALTVLYKVAGDRQWNEAIWLAGLIAAGVSIFLRTL